MPPFTSSNKNKNEKDLKLQLLDEENEIEYDADDTIFIPAIEEESEPGEVTVEKKKNHGIVFVICIIGILSLAGVFAAYFLGIFEAKDNLRMTPSEFSEKYYKTSGYSYISSYGFTIPEIVPIPYQENLGINFFNVPVDNSLLYTVDFGGFTNEKTKQIEQMYISYNVKTPNAFTENKEMFAPFVPFLQTVFPKMSNAEATDFLYDLFLHIGSEKIEGNYKVVIIDQSEDVESSLLLIFAGKDTPIQ